MVPGLGHHRTVGEDLVQPLAEALGLVEDTPGVGHHDQGQGGGEDPVPALVDLQEQGLAGRRLGNNRDKDSRFSFNIGLIIGVIVSVNTAVTTLITSVCTIDLNYITKLSIVFCSHGG